MRTPRSDGPGENPLVAEHGGRGRGGGAGGGGQTPQGLRSPCPPHSVFPSSGRGGDSGVCLSPHPGARLRRQLSSPAARGPRPPPTHEADANAPREHVQALSCSPLGKTCLLQRAGAQGEKGRLRRKSRSTGKTEPFKGGHGRPQPSALTVWAPLPSSGQPPSPTRNDTTI